MRNRQKCKKVLKANNPTIKSVPVRSLTSKSKTRTDSFDSVCHAKIPSAAYAMTARTSFRLVFKDPSQTTPRDFASGLPHSRPLNSSTWCTGKDSNLRTSLGGTDLQSVGFNHSPTCAKSLHAGSSFLFQPIAGALAHAQGNTAAGVA